MILTNYDTTIMPNHIWLPQKYIEFTQSLAGLRHGVMFCKRYKLHNQFDKIETNHSKLSEFRPAISFPQSSFPRIGAVDVFKSVPSQQYL